MDEKMKTYRDLNIWIPAFAGMTRLRHPPSLRLWRDRDYDAVGGMTCGCFKPEVL